MILELPAHIEEQLKINAELQGLSVENYIISLLPSQHINDSEEKITLNQEEWKKALDLLNSEPNEKMNTLFKRDYRAVR